MAAYEPWGGDYFVVKDTMPTSDWPSAVINERVYTLDGTMDARGPPTGGIDWYESRVAEPDAMLKDMIAVLHPDKNNYAPTDLTYLRHAATGTSHLVKANECSDASTPRPMCGNDCASGECAALGITKSELAEAKVLATKSTGIICMCGGHVSVCEHRVLCLKLLVVQAIRMV